MKQVAQIDLVLTEFKVDHDELVVYYDSNLDKNKIEAHAINEFYELILERMKDRIRQKITAKLSFINIEILEKEKT